MHTEGSVNLKVHQELKDNYNQLQIKHNRSLRRQTRYKMEKGYCVYLRTTDNTGLVHKLGKASDINAIMNDARRHFAGTVLEFCVYLSEYDYHVFEKCLKIK